MFICQKMEPINAMALLLVEIAVMPERKKVDNETAVTCLFDYAVDRDDLQLILEGIPEDDSIKRGTVEYEMRILRIVAVGWGVSFFMPESREKTRLAEGYWHRVAEFSGQISTVSSTMSGNDIDYFQVIRQRLDQYLAVLNHYQDAGDPAIVIGPTIAKMCGSEDNPYLIISGKKMFHIVLSGVKHYLDAIELIP